MEFNGKNLDVNTLVDELNIKDSFITYRYNDIYLSNKQIDVLRRNNFDYKKYTKLSSLIFDIEEYLNDNLDIDDELDSVLYDLSEINYYKNTRK